MYVHEDKWLAIQVAKQKCISRNIVLMSMFQKIYIFNFQEWK